MPLNVMPPDVPVVLSGQLEQIVADLGIDSDFLINGIPFMLRPSTDNPYIRDSNEDKKEQFDTSREAGENSFGQWWLRSQSTFHGGQGQKFLDSSDPTIARLRFYQSRNLFPHKAGEVTLAGAVTSAASSRSGVEQVTWSGTQKLVTMSTATFQINVATLPGLTSPSAINLGATGIPTAMTSDGVNVHVAIADKIYRINSSGTAVNTHTLTFTGPVVMGFAKQRLIVCVGNKVYELDPNPPSPPVAVSSPFYTNPSTAYVYTSVAEGPNGIYLTGFSGPASDVASMSVTESGGTVVLGPPIVQLRFPPGELVRSIFFYVSSLFAVATSNGVRVGSFTPYGQPQVGGLLIEGTPCYSLTGSGTLIWVGAKDSIWWVDLSTPTDQTGGYAHSKMTDGIGSDTNDPVNDIVVFTGTNDLVFGTTTSGRLLSQPTFIAVASATLTTSWARFDTVEPKQLHYITVEGENPSGKVMAETDDGHSVTFTMDGTRRSYEFSTAGLPKAQTFRATFTLTGGSLRSYQMKALPAPRKFKSFVLPLALFDQETPASGPPAIGYQGYAQERLFALEALSEANVRVTVVDNIAEVSYQAVIQRLQYMQDLAPTPRRGIGGTVNVALRLV